MNDSQGKGYNGYYTDEAGNVWSRDGRLISRTQSATPRGQGQYYAAPQGRTQNYGGQGGYQQGYRQAPNGYQQGYRQAPSDYRQGCRQAPSGYPQGYRQTPNGYQQGYRQAPNGYQQGYRQAPSGYPQGYRQSPQGYSQQGQYRQAPNGYPRTQQPYSQAPRRNRASLSRRPGMKGYESTVEHENPFKKYILIALAAIAAVVLLFFIIKAATTQHIGTLPDAPKETENTPLETEPADTSDAEQALSAAYSKRTDATVQLGEEIKCKNAILIDLDSHTVAAEKGGDEKIFPASMTKVMTALVALEHCDDLDATFVMTNEIVAPLAEANASVAGFVPGEEVTVRDLLYGTILPSGADGTGGLAAFVSGSEEEFAKLMNEKCEQLGLTGTHFSDASGLHKDDHYSTCHDIAVIMEAALQNDTLREIMGTDTYTTSITAEHPEGILLQDTMYSRVDGKEEFDGKIAIIAGKTGFTDEAGNCLVSAARVEGEEKTWIFVCAGGTDSKWVPIYDTIHIYRTYLGVHYDGEYVPKYMR